ncbi:hypothetical protein R38712_02121 [Ralstonia pickettii]|uniref:Uncharacterized protein n=1 Tax=Ralstonia pickettii TaxID=329 RepID=A0ABM9IM70_RALPI|nr:hypothetical protein R38712_02121 [Ralstonia pickettii]
MFVIEIKNNMLCFFTFKILFASISKNFFELVNPIRTNLLGLFFVSKNSFTFKKQKFAFFHFTLWSIPFLLVDLCFNKVNRLNFGNIAKVNFTSI